MIVRRIVVLIVAAAIVAAVVLLRQRPADETSAPRAAVEQSAEPAPSPPPVVPPAAPALRDEASAAIPAVPASEPAKTPNDDTSFELCADDDGRYWAHLFEQFAKGDVKSCVKDEWFVAFANPDHRDLSIEEMSGILGRHRGEMERIAALEAETDREQKAAVQRRIAAGFARPMIKTADGRQSVPEQTKRGMTSLIQVGPNEYNYVTLSAGDDPAFDARVKTERDAAQELVRALRTEIRAWSGEGP